jgi:hypothetical protein
MPISNLCHCTVCRPSIPPNVTTATPAELLAHAEHLRRLDTIGALPDPSYQPYPNPYSLPKTS